MMAPNFGEAAQMFAVSPQDKVHLVGNFFGVSLGKA